MDLLYIRGKRGNKVAVLLTKDIIKCIEVLISTRECIGVYPSNKYIFAVPTRNSQSYLRGNDCIAAVTSRCNLKNAAAIQSTKLRKYVATVSQILDLQDNEVEWLARHMGHDVNIHKEYYRLQDQTLELAKVSKLLLAFDEGNAGNFAGKKLDDITREGSADNLHFYTTSTFKDLTVF